MTEATRKRIKPAKEGVVVRDPVNFQPLAPEGQDKPMNAYWLRRLRDGDVVEVAQSKGNK